MRKTFRKEFNMIKLEKIENKEKVNSLRDNYFKSLNEPVDGFWETVMIGNSDCYYIFYDNKNIGHLSINNEKMLLQFEIFDNFTTYSNEVIKYLIENSIINGAFVSTKENNYLSLCLDFLKDLSIESYLFEDIERKEIDLKGFKDLVFRYANVNDIDIIIEKCGLPYKGYYDELIKNGQLFVLYIKNSFLGLGEFRIHKIHSKYADIGMIVAEEYRKKGVGTYILYKLKEHCYKNNVIPIASCDYKNIASKKTLIKAGFNNNNRIIKVEF